LKKLQESIRQRSDSDIKTLLREFVEYMPGPMTPQKFTKLDCYPNYSQVINVYNQVLEIILQHIHFVDYIDLISPIFAPDGGTLEMLDISLRSLWDYVSINAISSKTDCAIELMSSVLTSDLIKSSLIIETQNSNHDRFTNVIEFLLSLPSRLANKVGKNIPELFTPVEFSNRIVNHLLFVIDQLSQFYISENEKPNTKPLSIVLGKTIASYLQNDFSTALNILECWCLNDSYAIVIRSTLSEVNRRATDRLGYLFCRKLSNPTSLHNLMANAVIDMPNWKYTLCKKMIFLFYHEDDNIVLNLMNYLYLVQKESNSNVLSDIVLELVQIWSDKSALIHTPFEQHYYLSKLIVVGTVCLSNITLDEAFNRDLEIKLFEGVPIHLESSEEKVRTIGMIVAEIVIGVVKRHEKDAPSLNFQYDGLQEESKLIVQTLKELNSVRDNKELMFNHAFELLNTFFEGSSVIKSGRSVVTNVSHIRVVKNIDASIENNLDSDDDEFEPYDLSNDVKIDIKNRPKYVRDLIDGFNEQTDCKVWLGSLEVSESLIKSQLPNDDVTFAIELLTLLISMERQFYLENFESLRYKSAVAVVTVYPYDCAKHLCHIFYESIGKYAVSHRILILNVLMGSAKELSGFQKVEENQKGQTAGVNSSKYWEDVIKERVKQKTRIISNPRMPIQCQVNRFASVADAFFFPLIRGNLIEPIVVSQNVDNSKQLNVLGVHLLNSLSVILCCAINSVHVTRMSVELLEWTWSLRFHNDVKVRMAVMGCVAAVLLSVPKSRLVDLENSLAEFAMWLENVVTSEGVMNKVDNEVNQEAREFAVQVLLLYRNTVGNHNNILFQ